MHWATHWRHSALSVTSSSASSQVMSMSFKSHLMMSIRFFLGRPSFLLYPLSFHWVAWRDILEFSILKTWPSHLSLLSLMTSSNFCNPVFLLISSFLTLSFHVIPSSLRWNLWWAASSFFIWEIIGALIWRHTVMLRWQVTHTAWLLLEY